MSPELVLDRRGPSLMVRLNRPEARNALTPALIAGIGSAVADAKEGAMAFIEKRPPQWTGA